MLLEIEFTNNVSIADDHLLYYIFKTYFKIK